MNTFARKLKELRELHGLTQPQLAEKIGVGKSTISMYEQGARMPSYETIEAISDYFNTSIDILLGTEQTGWLPRTTAHATRYEALDDEGKDAVDYTTEREERRMGTVKATDRTVPLMVSLQGVSAGTGTYLFPDDFRTVQVKESLLPHGVKFAVPIDGDSMEPAFFDGQLALVGNEFASDGQIGIFAVNGDGYIKELHGQCLHSLNPKYEDIPFDSDTIRPIGKIIGVLDPTQLDA